VWDCHNHIAASAPRIRRIAPADKALAKRRRLLL
jgi:hypothetical protein